MSIFRNSKAEDGVCFEGLPRPFSRLVISIDIANVDAVTSDEPAGLQLQVTTVPKPSGC
mgnify:CR=1 FL=1